MTDLNRLHFRRFCASVVRAFFAILPPMNSINNTLTGLASSLLLNVGLTGAAEKFDPMHKGSISNKVLVSAEPCEGCVMFCAFTPETGQ
ncbi:MAG: hypothetical protein PSV13_21565 [Lacunisphaera sp.]|nr:hypothetical protein [Lacunisphaera sp.]